MEVLLEHARFSGARIILVIRSEIWHDHAVPEDCSSVVLNWDKIARATSPVSSTRSTAEPEEFENACYVGFSGYRPIQIGRKPRAQRKILLPRRPGFCKTHLELRLTKFGTWVVKNLSRRKLWVNHIPTEPGQSTALDLAEGYVNQIRIINDFLGCVIVYDSPLSLQLIDNHLLDLSQRQNDTGFPENTLEELSIGSHSSSSSDLSGRSQVLEDSVTNYYVLDFTRLEWSSTACYAIRARACPNSRAISVGARYLIHRFEEMYHEDLALFYLRFRLYPPHPHLATVLDFDKSAGLLVQHYFGAESVQYLDTTGACIAFRQLLSAILERHSQGIVHGCVEPRFVIQNFALNAVVVQLDGYWYKRVLENDTEAPPFRPCQDLCQLADTILELLQRYRLYEEDKVGRGNTKPVRLNDLPKPMDPLLLNVIEMAQQSDIRIEELSNYVENLTLGNDDAFLGFTRVAVKIPVSYQNGRYSTGRTEPVFRREDLEGLWDKILRSRPNIVYDTDLDLLHQLPPDALWIRRSQLKKVAAPMRSRWREILDLLPSSIDSKTLVCDVEMQVACIKSCALVNLSQLIAAIGFDKCESACPWAYELRGRAGYTGFYAPINRLMQISDHDIRTLLLDLQQSAQPSRSAALKRYAPTQYILFATSLQWCAVIVMRRVDFYSNWDPFSKHDNWLTVEESYKRCDLFGLAHLKREVREFVQRPSHERPPPLSMTDQLLANVEGPKPGQSGRVCDSDSDIGSDCDSDDTLRFRRRK